MTGYGSYDVPKGVWSDDTAMTLATMDSIINCCKINYDDIASRFCDWLNYAKYTATGIVFDIGITTKRSLIKFYKIKKDAVNCGGKNINENGNGSLMRMLPVGLYCYYKNLGDKEIYEVVKNVSSITHAHEISVLGCYIYVYYLLFILRGNDKLSSYNLIKEINYNKYFSKEAIKEYEKILSGNIQALTLDDIKSTGYIVDTLETVIWVILNTGNFQQAIIGAVNLGGDTDTIGAITGSIAGLLYGFGEIPNGWLTDLRNKEYLNKIINEFESMMYGI